jgi:hypothetical protein
LELLDIEPVRVVVIVAFEVIVWLTVELLPGKLITVEVGTELVP